MSWENTIKKEEEQAIISAKNMLSHWEGMARQLKKAIEARNWRKVDSLQS